MKYLITSSLLDSYDWLKSCPKNWQQRALDDFIAMIKRQPRPTSEACQRGIDFERHICDNCNEMKPADFGSYAEWYWKSKGCKDERLEKAVYVSEKIAEACRNGQQQVTVMKDIEFDGNEYHLFGYADIVFPQKIIDIKTTGYYKGDEPYLKRSQHYLYSLCTGIKDFEYVIAVFSGKYPSEVKRVNISMIDDECTENLHKKIRVVTRFIKNAGLWEDYKDYFTGGHKDIRAK